MIRQVGESAMREIVGTSAFEPITTGDRTGVEIRVRDLMQQTLNGYKSGIEVVSISLKEATAPPEVVEVQRDVSNAEQDKARRSNEATAYLNKVVPEARGNAQRMIQEAEAYKASSVANATGEAQRFTLIYDQYQKAPRVTRERMYLETMEGVLGRSDRIIIDGDGFYRPAWQRLVCSRTNWCYRTNGSHRQPKYRPNRPLRSSAYLVFRG
jgi:membrane protease subunit HflK